MSVKDKRVSIKRTICEVHREIYDLISESVKDQSLLNRLVNLLEEAYVMGKKMNLKLRQYKNNYDDKWWEENKNYIDSLRKRKN